MMERAGENNTHPIDLLLQVVDDENEVMQVRLNAAVHVLPYIAPKLVATDVTKDAKSEVDEMSPAQKIERIQSLVERIAERRPEMLTETLPQLEQKSNGDGRPKSAD